MIMYSLENSFLNNFILLNLNYQRIYHWYERWLKYYPVINEVTIAVWEIFDGWAAAKI